MRMGATVPAAFWPDSSADGTACVGPGAGVSDGAGAGALSGSVLRCAPGHPQKTGGADLVFGSGLRDRADGQLAVVYDLSRRRTVSFFCADGDHGRGIGLVCEPEPLFFAALDRNSDAVS